MHTFPWAVDISTSQLLDHCFSWQLSMFKLIRERFNRLKLGNNSFDRRMLVQIYSTALTTQDATSAHPNFINHGILDEKSTPYAKQNAENRNKDKYVI